MLWGALAAGDPDRAALLLPQPLPHGALGGHEVPAHQHRADQPPAASFQELLLLLSAAPCCWSCSPWRWPGRCPRRSAARAAATPSMPSSSSTPRTAWPPATAPATRLDRAKAAALAVIDQLPPHSTVQIVALGRPRRRCSARASPANLDQARAADREPAARATWPPTSLPASAEAAAIAATRPARPTRSCTSSATCRSSAGTRSPARSCEKLQRRRQAGEPSTWSAAAPQAPRNVAIVGITPQSGVPHPGERVGFAVLVRNTGSEAVRNLSVSLTVDGQDDKTAETQPLAVLDPGETRRRAR